MNVCIKINKQLHTTICKRLNKVGNKQFERIKMYTHTHTARQRERSKQQQKKTAQQYVEKKCCAVTYRSQMKFIRMHAIKYRLDSGLPSCERAVRTSLTNCRVHQSAHAKFYHIQIT